MVVTYDYVTIVKYVPYQYNSKYYWLLVFGETYFIYHISIYGILIFYIYVTFSHYLISSLILEIYAVVYF